MSTDEGTGTSQDDRSTNNHFPEFLDAARNLATALEAQRRWRWLARTPKTSTKERAHLAYDSWATIRFWAIPGLDNVYVSGNHRGYWLFRRDVDGDGKLHWIVTNSIQDPAELKQMTSAMNAMLHVLSQDT